MIKRKSRKPLPNNSLSDIQIGMICNQWAIKGLRLKYGLSGLDVAIIMSLWGQVSLVVGAICQLVGRDRKCCYAIMSRAANRGFVEQIGGGKMIRYRLTQLGIDAYGDYVIGYQYMYDNLMRLEGLRLDREANMRAKA